MVLPSLISQLDHNCVAPTWGCMEIESLGGVTKISLNPIHPIVISLHIILSHLRLQTVERHGDRITCHLVSKVSLCPSGVHVSAGCPRREVGAIMAEHSEHSEHGYLTATWSARAQRAQLLDIINSDIINTLLVDDYYGHYG